MGSKSMIDYLTHPKSLNYDPAISPSSQGGGGGMSTKTYRVLEAQEFGTDKPGADVNENGVVNASDLVFVVGEMQ